MKLYINRDIAADADKMQYWLTGDDAVSYSDIASALDYMAEVLPEDNRIDIEIHSCGGDCVEGYAIYDALRASGKEIHCCVVGQCASMATIILLAAPAENRTMYEHAQLLIHEPYFPNGIAGAMTLDKLQGVTEALSNEKAKMVKVYAERTGTDEATLLEQIGRGDWFGSARALELNFVSSVVPAISAKADEPIISTTIQTQNKEMKIKEESALAKAYVALGRAMGVVEDDAPKALTLTDVTGTEIEIDREEGEPQVGDTTSAADGEYTLEDGRTIVVKDGVITEIKDAENPTEEETEETPTEEDDEKKALRDEIDELKKQLEEAKANAISEEQNAVLDAVAKVGGIEAIKATAVGKFAAPVRTPATPVASATEEFMARKVAEAREANAAKRKK